MSKLAASGLTSENIKKLATLCEAASLQATEGSQASNFVEAVSSKRPALGPVTVGENVEKPVVIESTKGSQVVRAPHHSDDSLVLPSSSFSEDPFDSSTWTVESNWQGSPHPFETLPMIHLSPNQLPKPRKRATTEEESSPPPKKKGRHEEAEYMYWTENDEVIRARHRPRDGRSQPSSFSASGEIQVDTPLCRATLHSPGTTTNEVTRRGFSVDAVAPGLTTSPGLRKVRATQVNASHWTDKTCASVRPGTSLPPRRHLWHPGCLAPIHMSCQLGYQKWTDMN